MSAERVFLDTNVLVCAHYRRDPRKRAIAMEIINGGIREGTIAISGQVLSEFVSVMTRKAIPRLSVAQVAEAVAEFDEVTVVPVGSEMVKRSLAIQEREQVACWDALILAAAESAGCSLLLSEDFGHGRRYGDVEVRNPFRDEDPAPLTAP